MVAFPQVVITLGEKPDWVKNMGDAFLAQPEDVMDSVQRLRAQAQKAGQPEVERTGQSVDGDRAARPTRGSTPPPPQVIVIEPANRRVVYVPPYNPAVVYGAWPYPAYPPYYYPTRRATGFARGRDRHRLGRRHRRRQRAVGRLQLGRRRRQRQRQPLQQHQPNNQINAATDNAQLESTTSSNRKERAYRGGDATRQNLQQQISVGNREQYRGKDADRAAASAQQTMQSRGVESPIARRAERCADRGNLQQQARNQGCDSSQRERGAAIAAAARRAFNRESEQQRSGGGRDKALQGASDPGARTASRSRQRKPAVGAVVQRGGGGGRSQRRRRRRRVRGGGGGGGARRWRWRGWRRRRTALIGSRQHENCTTHCRSDRARARRSARRGALTLAPAAVRAEGVSDARRPRPTRSSTPSRATTATRSRSSSGRITGSTFPRRRSGGRDQFPRGLGEGAQDRARRRRRRRTSGSGPKAGRCRFRS